MITKICKTCGKKFEIVKSRKNRAKFCSYECKNKFQLGKKASKDTKRKMREIHLGQVPWNKGFKMLQTSGKNHWNWKNGKIKRNGYWYIWKPEHPYSIKQGYVKCSHLVAEKILGRYLTKIEIIHHINGNTFDDRPENLYLFETVGEHIKYHWQVKRKEIKPIAKSNLI